MQPFGSILRERRDDFGAAWQCDGHLGVACTGRDLLDPPLEPIAWTAVHGASLLKSRVYMRVYSCVPRVLSTGARSSRAVFPGYVCKNNASQPLLPTFANSG